MNRSVNQLGARSFLALLATSILCWLTAGVGCHREAPVSDGPRLVSISPGVTEIIEELGLADKLVGVSQYCEVENTPARTIGSLYTLDTEVLLSLRPTHVFYQGNPERFERLQARHGEIHFANYRLQTLDDVVGATEQIAALIGLPERGGKLTSKMKMQLRTIRERSRARTPRNVAFVIPSGTGQYLVAAGGNFIDTLIDAAHGFNVGRQLTGGDAWQTIPQEHLLSLGAELIIVHGKPIGNARSNTQAEQLGAYIDQAGIALKRVAVTEARHFTVPSIQLTEAAEEIFRLIHPEAGVRR